MKHLIWAVMAGAVMGGTRAQPMKQVAIWDPVFKMPAYTMTIPADWEFEGAMFPGHGCGDTPMGSVVYRANSPDGLTGVQRLPVVNRFWSSERQTLQLRGFGNCKVEAVPAGERLVKRMATEMRGGVELGPTGPPPTAAKFADYLRQTDQLFRNAAAKQGNPNSWRFTGDTQRVRIRYDYASHPLEEFVTVEETIVDQPTMGPMGNYPNGVVKLGVTRVTQWSTMAIGSRAPRGRLDAVEGELQAIHDSLKEIPEYHRAYTEFFQKQSAQMMADIQRMGGAALLQGERSQAALAGQRAQFNQQFERRAAERRQQFAGQMAEKDQKARAFQAKMDAREGRSRDYVDTILDQQLFYDPRTGTSTTQSNQYNHTFGDGNGGVVQTNSPSFDPNAALSGNWTELRPIRH